jgi:hypothetical protein
VSTPVELHDLIEALAGAVIEAQDRIEQHQIANLGSYFDADNRPRSVLIRLQSLSPDAHPGDEDLYRAPLLPLVACNPLKIKEVEITFDVDLGTVGDPLDAATPQADSAWLDPKRVRKTVNVQTTGNLLGRRKSTAHVVLRVEGGDATDGMARLMGHLTQTQGVVKTIKDA